MAAGYVTDARFALHDLPEHPENARRLEAIGRGLEEAGLLARLEQLEPDDAPDDLLLTAHTATYLDTLRRSSQGMGTMFGLDTYATPASYGVARLAVGAAVAAVRAVLEGRVSGALAGLRPPGHHATPSQAMGFCLLNSVAVAARYAQQAHGVGRIAIIDYDVHHGNGTQDIFYADPSVLFVSLHQSPLYPGTGHAAETGTGEGQGTTVNVPLPPGVGDAGYAAAFEQVVVPVVGRFAPALILVSVGFDAHWADPLAQMGLTLAGYAHLARSLIALARRVCGGRIVFALEGGYNLTVLGRAWADVARALLDEPTAPDTLGPSPSPEPDIEPLLARVRRLHQLG